MTGAVKLEKMKAGDVNEAAKLVAEAMDAEEGVAAKTTMLQHFKCRNQGIMDGRDYYICHGNGYISGLVGLHHYVWGPKENVWLGWFAVHPNDRRKGLGRQLMDAIVRIAESNGYRKLFVETYSSPTFADACEFYRAMGFQECGRISNYMPDGSNMIVFRKKLIS